MKMNDSQINPRELLQQMFAAAVAAAQPDLCIPRYIPEPPKGRLIVIGAGKASAAMARAVENSWPSPLEGLVVTRYGYAVPCQHIEIAEAAHPVPDLAGELASRRILELVSGLTADDLVLCLISGGGSCVVDVACSREFRWKTSRRSIEACSRAVPRSPR